MSVLAWFLRKAWHKKPNSLSLIDAEPQGTSELNDYRKDNQLVPYDENLLERVRTQWQFGDWCSVAALGRNTVQSNPDRAKLALMAAAGRLQIGENAEARQFVVLAQDWGVSKKLVSQILISGVHNSLGRAAAIGTQQHRAFHHFETAIAIGTPGSDSKLLTPARTREQLSQLGLTTQGGYAKVDGGRKAVRDGSQPSSPETLETPANEKYANFSSGQYWEERYQKGGTSGFGSYGRLAEFKAKVINKFIEEEGVEHVIEFGCGDGNQLSMLRVKNYVGVDISPTVIEKCKLEFKSNVSRLFLTNDKYLENPLKGMLTLSLDVIFHLVEDDVFEKYMKMLFDAAEHYCIIYACDEEWLENDAAHIRRRKFTKWITENLKEWRLTQVTFNEYPHDGSRNPTDLSFSNFYFYKRV